MNGETLISDLEDDRGSIEFLGRFGKRQYLFLAVLHTSTHYLWLQTKARPPFSGVLSSDADSSGVQTSSLLTSGVIVNQRGDFSKSSGEPKTSVELSR